MTLKEASNSAKLTPEVLRNYESGRTVIPAHVFNRLCEIYKIPCENIRLPEEEDEDHKVSDLVSV